MDIHEYLGVLRRGVVLILIGILVGLAGGFVAQSMERPSYSATSRELLTNKVAGDLSISQGRIASYVLVASSGLVLQPVIDELQLDTSVEELAQRVSVVAPPNTLVIEITATASHARRGAATPPTRSADLRRGGRRPARDDDRGDPDGRPDAHPRRHAPPGARRPSPSTTRLPDGTVVPIAIPTAPVRVVNLEQAALPSAPNPSVGPLMLLVGGVLGLALGLLAASLREAFDRRVRTPRDVARVTDVPVVGAIVSDRRIRSTPLAARAGSRSPAPNRSARVRGHLDHLRERDGRRVFVLTAAGRRQGTTTVAANVAVAIANAGTTVVVVDADLRRPASRRCSACSRRPDSSGLLTGRTELESVLRGSGTPGLTVVPAGSAAVNAGELIATPRMRTVLAELARRFEVVIIDTPSIATASEAAVLGALTGSTLLIVQQGATTRPRLDDALALLEAGGSEPIGIVLTRTRRNIAGRAPQAPPAAGASSKRAVPARGARAGTGCRARRGPVSLRSRSPSRPCRSSPAARSRAAPHPVSTAVAVRVRTPSRAISPTRCPGPRGGSPPPAPRPARPARG